MIPKKGFTLLEILVASLLMAVALMGLASIFVTGKGMVLHARYRMSSAELAKIFLSPLQMAVRQDTWNNNITNALGLGSGDTRIYTNNLTLNKAQYNATYNITNVTNNGTIIPRLDLRKVRLDVIWNETVQ